MIRIILFGPPGVGKTDIIRLAQSKDIPAYDIEAFGHDYEDRKKGFRVIDAMDKSDYVIFASSDLKLNDINPFMKTVLLLPEKDDYLKRIAKSAFEYQPWHGMTPLQAYEYFADNRNKFDMVFFDVVASMDFLKEILIKTDCPGRYLI